MRIFVAQQQDDFMAQAQASAKRYRAGKSLGPLDGVPVAVKDELDLKGYPTTVGTVFLGQESVAEDAEPVARLRAAGALLIGKTNMHEIGLGVTGINPGHGTARNPYHPDHATGGSSSGSAAAVAAGYCPLALGADGGGSVRLPASFCGVVGLKPTFGRVSERGAAPLCWSVAHVGPIGDSVRDVATAYAAVAGPDERDRNSLSRPAPHLADLAKQDLAGIRIGVYSPWFDDADPEVVDQCRKQLKHLVQAGCQVVEIEVPELERVGPVHMIIIATEMAAAHLEYYKAHRKHYSTENRVNLALARRLRATDYIHAQRLRNRICDHFDRAFTKVDVIATPTNACTAPKIGKDSLKTGESNMSLTTQIMRYSPVANLTGQPAISVPAGYDQSGLPVGFQMMGRAYEEHLLLRLAAVAEGAISHRRPKVYNDLLAAD